MDFIDQLQVLSKRLEKQIGNIKTEEATKNALVMPFIQALGYDIFDPTEVVPEFIADVGKKKGEKVDYAIMTDGKPTMLFECKCCESDLNDANAGQLRRYFHVTSARIGVLTNGKSYHFYSDLEQSNIMDDTPFMVVDLTDMDEQNIPSLKKLSKSSFELEQMLNTASQLKYLRAVKNAITDEFLNPSPEFIKHMVGQVYNGIKTQQVIDQFTPIVQDAFKQFVHDRIKDRFNSVMDEQSKEIRATAPIEEETDTEQENDRGIVTTEEEMEGFYIVRAILREVVDISRVNHRDTKSYFGILLDDNNRKPLCRLRFNTSQKYLGIMAEDKSETKIPLNSLDDIYNHADAIKTTVAYYE